MNSLGRDFAYAIRALRRSPRFAVLALATIAIGLGPNIAVFSMVEAVFLQNPPYFQPDRLVMVYQHWPGGGPTDDFAMLRWSFPYFEDVRQSNHVFSSMAAFRRLDLNVATPGALAIQVRTEMVSSRYFQTLGVDPRLGRAFLPNGSTTSEVDGSSVVLGHRVSLELFGADSLALGKTVLVNGTPTTVIGIVPSWFSGVSGAAEMWVPTTFARSLFGNTGILQFRQGVHFFEVFARLRPGVSLSQGQLDVQRTWAHVVEVNPVPSPGSWSVRLGSLKDLKIDPRLRSWLPMLYIAAVLVSLIASLNVAVLLLSRREARKREIAIRTAIGAGTVRIGRQLMTESFLLAVLGAVASILLALPIIELLPHVLPIDSALPASGSVSEFSALQHLHPDGTLLVYAALATILVTLVFGLAPAIQALRKNVLPDLAHERPRSGISRGRRYGVREVLVALQVASALMLLSGTGAVIATLIRLRHVDVGISDDSVLTTKVNIPGGASSDDLQRLLGDVEATPGVSEAASASCLPVSHGACDWTRTPVKSMDWSLGNQTIDVDIHYVGGKYFDALSIPLLSGRRFTRDDRSGSPLVVIVSKSAARKFWPHQNAIGRTLTVADGGKNPRTVVGIVGDVRYGAVDQVPQPTVYVPAQQAARHLSSTSFFVIVKTKLSPVAFGRTFRAAVRVTSSNGSASEFRTLGALIAGSTSNLRFGALFLGVSGAIALALAIVGIFGVVSYTVAQRTQEIGFRMAIGAGWTNILALVSRKALVPAAAGFALGSLGSAALLRVLAGVVAGVEAKDVIVASPLVVICLISVAATAALIPARRAFRLNPADVLRHE